MFDPLPLNAETKHRSWQFLLDETAIFHPLFPEFGRAFEKDGANHSKAPETKTVLLAGGSWREVERRISSQDLPHHWPDSLRALHSLQQGHLLEASTDRDHDAASAVAALARDGNAAIITQNSEVALRSWWQLRKNGWDVVDSVVLKMGLTGLEAWQRPSAGRGSIWAEIFQSVPPPRNLGLFRLVIGEGALMRVSDNDELARQIDEVATVFHEFAALNPLRLAAQCLQRVMIEERNGSAENQKKARMGLQWAKALTANGTALLNEFQLRTELGAPETCVAILVNEAGEARALESTLGKGGATAPSKVICLYVDMLGSVAPTPQISPIPPELPTTPPTSTPSDATPAPSSSRLMPKSLLGDDVPLSEVQILVDTSFLMKGDAPEFWRALLRPFALQVAEARKKSANAPAPIAVPRPIENELRKLTKCGVPEREAAADSGLRLLASMLADGLAEVLAGSQDTSFGDPVLLSSALFLIQNFHLVLLTNDTHLGSAVANVMKERAMGVRKLFKALLLGRNNQLSPAFAKRRTERRRSRPDQHLEEPKAFSIHIEPKQDADLPLQEVVIPGPGIRVRGSDSGWLVIGEKIAEGGEGRIHVLRRPGGANEPPIETGMVAKLYHQKCRTRHRELKIRRMVDVLLGGRPLAGTAWPREIIMDLEGAFLGYAMPRIRGIKLDRGLLSAAGLQRHFPHWKRVDLVNLGLSFLRRLSRLHEYNVYVGDLSGANILIDSRGRLWFVDCDSFQFADFPSTVYTPAYSHPELLEWDFKKKMRKLHHEQFAAAVLLFMILFPGQSPYLLSGGTNLAEAMRPEKFIFGGLRRGPDRRRSHGPPVSFLWQNIWSHLIKDVQDLFLRAFVDQSPVELRQWMITLDNYRYAIEKGHVDQLGHANEIWPPARRLSKQGLQSHQAAGGNVETLSFLCEDCQRSFTVIGRSNIEDRRNAKPVLCDICRAKHDIGDEQGSSRICQNCGGLYELPIWLEEDIESEKKGFPQWFGNRWDWADHDRGPVGAHNIHKCDRCRAT